MRSTRCRLPSNFASPLKSTVRIGTLMPTPSVSVPQMTVSRPGLRERLHQPPVARQHPGVVHADPTAEQLLQRLAEARPEPEAAQPVLERLDGLLGRARPRDVEQRDGVLDGGGLGEVHDVDRRLLRRDDLLERLVEVRQRVGEGQRHRSLGVVDHRGLAGGTPRQVGGQVRDVAERRGHQQELHVDQLEQRHLPRPAAVGLGVVVELVHHHEPDVGAASLAQRDVGEHLGGAGDDGRVRVDRRVSGQHPDVVGAEDVDQREELLVDERLDRRGVERPPPGPPGREVGCRRHQRLPGPGRGGQDDVRPAHQLQHGLLLVRVEAEALLPHPGEEGVVGVRWRGAHRARGCAVAKTCRRLSTVTSV